MLQGSRFSSYRGLHAYLRLAYGGKYPLQTNSLFDYHTPHTLPAQALTLQKDMSSTTDPKSGESPQ